MIATFPSVITWSKNSSNHCIIDTLPAYWNNSDALTFLADIGRYNPSLLSGLDDAERDRVLQFKSEYFKQRFVVSRSLLKSILVHLGRKHDRNALVLLRKHKRILVPGEDDIFVSLSYSGSTLAITIARRKIGTDIETVHPVDLRKVRSSPLFDHAKPKNKKEESTRSLHLWTVVEAYAKLRDLNPYPLLAKSSLLPGFGSVSYCIDKRLILSLAYDTGNLEHAIFWIDPRHWPLESQDQLISPYPR
jgi:4'-phosphopantetheinyl transferase